MAIGILGALYQKKETGVGQRLTVAMQDAMLQYARLAFSDTMKTGKPSARAGEGVVTGGNAPMGLFPCKPGGSNDYVYIYVNRANNRQWHRLLEVIGQAELIGDPQFETARDRYANKDEINAMLIPWTQARTKAEAMETVGGAGVPCSAVYDTVELQDNPDFETRGIFQWVDHPTRGKVKMPAWPVQMSGNDVKVKPAPLLGQHNEDVLSDWLGMSDDDMAALKTEVPSKQGFSGRMAIEISPLSGAIGAEVTGIDLNKIGEAGFADIRQALFDHGVICIRDQDLTPDQQVAFAERWGEIHLHPYLKGLPDQPEIMEIVKGWRQKPLR